MKGVHMPCKKSRDFMDHVWSWVFNKHVKDGVHMPCKKVGVSWTMFGQGFSTNEKSSHYNNQTVKQILLRSSIKGTLRKILYKY
jgi:hypothetical protein